MKKLKKSSNDPKLSAHEDVAQATRSVMTQFDGTLRNLRKHEKEPSLAESFRESFENPTFILSSIVVGVCAFRFLFDGVTFGALGLTLNLGHTDPLAYGSILTPVIAGHAFIRAKGKTTPNQKVDNPDASE